MSQTFIDRQLAAGGLVAPTTACDPKLTEAIVARTYISKALGDRFVISLSSNRLVPAEDLAMEYLGLEGQSTSAPVARQNRTALDFAHWALINQPKQARYALDLVKRMKSAARRASSKPGHAWDMYAEMADELNKSVRHFLPPFWEQVARSFKDLGNVTYAGRALNKALEAERVHALKVDREHRRDAVLEFSLNGCLSSKALTDYSKDLADQFAPAEAYATYKDLVIRRTMGGMPPAANAASDLIRMAKVANIDADKEVESILESIIASPAMSRAPLQFWKSVKKHVGRIVDRNPSFAIWLLAHTDPKSRYTDDSLVWQWLDLLEQWKVLPWLSQPKSAMPTDVDIPGGRAGWFGRLASVEPSPDKRVFELLEQMADVLRDEGQAIPLTPSRSWRSFIDVDVLEACLELGLEVEAPSKNVDLNFDGWLRADVDHPRRNSQLRHIMQDPRYAPRLRDKIPELIQFRGEDRVNRATWGRKLATRRAFEEAAAGQPSVREAWWRYLDGQLQALETGGLVDFEEALDRLRGCTGRGTAAEFPELLPRLRAVDAVACLQRTLAAGVFDEYGWETLDKVAEEHAIPSATRRQAKVLHWVFPRFAFLKDDHVHVVDPESHSPPRELTLTTQQNLLVLLPVGEDLLVAYRDNGRSWKTFIRWISEPKEEHEQPQNYYSWDMHALVPHRDSAFFYGARAIEPGDRQLPDANKRWFSDGARFWRVKDRFGYAWLQDEAAEGAGHSGVSEVDPATGQDLRDSVPPFFETNLPPGSRINWHLSYLLPLPAVSLRPPLGSRDGLIGSRVIHRRDGGVETIGIDGRRFVFEADAQPSDGFVAAVGQIDKPASDASWIVTNDGRLLDSESRIAFARVDGGHTKYFAGQPAHLPTLFYHLMQVRCSDSSMKLRETTAKQAGILIEAGRQEHQARKTKEDPGHPDPARSASVSAVAEWLEKASPRLVTGVARIARVAAEEKISLENLLKRLEPQDESTNTSATATAVDTERARKGLIQLGLPHFEDIRLYNSETDAEDNAAHLMAVGRFFGGLPGEEKLSCSLFWFELLRDPVATAWRCFWRTGTNESIGESIAARLNTPWLDALEVLADSKLLDLPGSYKIYQASVSSGVNANPNSLVSRLPIAHPLAFQEGKSRYVGYRFQSFPDDQVFILEYAAGGKPQPPKKLTVDLTVDVQPGWKSRELRSFIKAVRNLSELPLPTAEELSEASAELNIHPIAVALSFMGDLRTVHYGQEKLTKELRSHYGWKVKEIQLAISQLEGIDRPKAVGSVYLRVNPSGAFGEKREVAFKRMVEAWQKNSRNVLQIPPELAKDLERFAGSYHRLSVKMLAEMISDPANSEILQRRKAVLTRPKQKRYRESIEIEYTPAAAFAPDAVYPFLSRAIALVNYRLPIGDPLRKQIPLLVDEIRRFIDDPETQLPFGESMTEFEDANSIDVDGTLAKFASHVGGLEQDSEGIYRGIDRLFSVALVPPNVGMMFRTAELTNESELERLRAVAGLTMRYGEPGGDRLPCPEFVLRMRSEAISELAEDNRRCDVAEGRWEQDPRVSAPATVERAREHLSVSENAATLYLQMLSLPDPTERNIRLWNEWSAKQYKEAAAELLGSEHVVTAKRSRAGRAIFLPGGWEPLGLPNLPIESWKLSLFGYDSNERLRGGGAELIICARSLGRQFETAWQRVEEGDPPQYTEATLKRKRK